MRELETGFFISDENRDLHPTLGEVAEVIGREKALYIAGVCGGGNLYVPVKAGPKHRLSEIIGLESAQALSKEFGGIVLKIPKCCHLERRHRDESIIRLFSQGYKKEELAEMFSVNIRTVYSVLSPYTSKPKTKHPKTIIQLSLLGKSFNKIIYSSKKT